MNPKSNFILKTSLAVIFAGFTSGCSHNPTYTAEVAGKGAKHANDNGVVYTIPPKSQNLKVKVISKGINADRQLVIRLYFYRPQITKTAYPEFLDRNDFSLTYAVVPTQVRPVKIHSSRAQGTRIVLKPAQKQMIELAFPIPTAVRELETIQSFTFTWTIHDANGNADLQSTVFDQNDTRANAPNITDFPEDIDAENFWVVDPGWFWW
jgi:hypothetical protein